MTYFEHFFDCLGKLCDLEGTVGIIELQKDRRQDSEAVVFKEANVDPLRTDEPILVTVKLLKKVMDKSLFSLLDNFLTSLVNASGVCLLFKPEFLPSLPPFYFLF